MNKMAWNALAGPSPEQNEGADWTRRLMQRFRYNPYPQFGGQEFTDNIFVTPQAPANTLDFDRNAISPDWLDSSGRLYQPK